MSKFSNDNKKDLPKKIERRFFTDMEMKSFDSQLTPFLVNGKLTKDSEIKLILHLKLAKLIVTHSQSDKTKEVSEMSLFPSKIEEYFTVQKKLSQWPYWKKGVDFSKVIEDSFGTTSAMI